MTLEEAMGDSWDKAASGQPMHLNADGTVGIELPEIIVTPNDTPQPAGESWSPDAPKVMDTPLPASPVGQVDTLDFGPPPASYDPNDPKYKGNLSLRSEPGVVDDTKHWITEQLSGAGMDPYNARAISEGLLGGPNAVGLVHAIAMAAGGAAMVAGSPITIGGAAIASLPSMVAGTAEGLHQVADGIKGVVAGDDGAGLQTGLGVLFTALNALGLSQGSKELAKVVGPEAARLISELPRMGTGGASIEKVTGMIPEPQTLMAAKIVRARRGTMTTFNKDSGETRTQFAERLNREAPIVTTPDEFVKTYGEIPALPPEAPSPAVALRTGAAVMAPKLEGGTFNGRDTFASPFAQVGGYFDSVVRMKNGGMPRTWENPKNQAQILDEAYQEVRHQLNLGDPKSASFTKQTGFGWYDEDIVRAFEHAGSVMPELKPGTQFGVQIPHGAGLDNVTPAQARTLVAAVGAPQSFGNPAGRNKDIALQAYEVFRRTGQFPEKGIVLDELGNVQSTGKYWTQRGVSEQYIAVLNTLIREVGPAKAADWLVTPHAIRELRELKRRATKELGDVVFKGDGTMNVSGKAADEKPGAFIFGPKGGQFMGNLLGFPGTTTDMWYSRTWNRYAGTSREGIGALGDTGLVEQPRNLVERANMADLSRKLTGRLASEQDLVATLGRPPTERDTQAILWYFEQQLYKSLGINVTPQSFGEGAATYAARAKAQGGTGIKRATPDKSGGRK